jgi:hypothetical protein
MKRTADTYEVGHENMRLAATLRAEMLDASDR